MKTPVRYAFVVAALTSLAIVGRAAAQQTPADRADALFEEGRKAADAGDYITARERFNESLRAAPAVGTLMNLADAEDHVGRLVESLARWKEALALARKTNDPRVEFIQDRIGRLQARIPTLTIEVAGKLPRGTRISHGGTALRADEIGKPIPVNPGRHVSIGSAPGLPEERMEVTVDEGQHKVVRLTFHRTSPIKADTEPDHTLAYVLGGVGAAGVMAGVVTGWMLRSRQHTIDQHCDSSTKACNDQAGVEAAEAAKDLVPFNLVAWSVGIVGLGSGAVVYLSGRRGHQESVAGMTVGGRF